MYPIVIDFYFIYFPCLTLTMIAIQHNSEPTIDWYEGMDGLVTLKLVVNVEVVSMEPS